VTDTGSVWAVVPVKPFRVAKARLGTALGAAERAQLARVMVEDVLGALDASRHVLAGVIVLTTDDEAAAIARDHRALVIDEAAPVGINAAIGRALDYLALAEGGAARLQETGMLVVPADLPHVSVAAVERIVGLLDAPRAVAIVPATSDRGTNLLACRPAGIIPPSFGPQSFDRHCEAARQAGVTPTILTWADLGRDIDRPEDLAAFLSLDTATRTHAFLSTLGRVALTP
jgi:2-phospho-L-lactate/phosphoenolpyruvate guanylyltransferase